MDRNQKSSTFCINGNDAMVYVRTHLKACSTRSSRINQVVAKIFYFNVQESIPNTPVFRRCKKKLSDENVRETSWQEFIKKKLFNTGTNQHDLRKRTMFYQNLSKMSSIYL